MSDKPSTGVGKPSNRPSTVRHKQAAAAGATNRRMDTHSRVSIRRGTKKRGTPADETIRRQIVREGKSVNDKGTPTKRPNAAKNRTKGMRKTKRSSGPLATARRRKMAIQDRKAGMRKTNSAKPRSPLTTRAPSSSKLRGK